MKKTIKRLCLILSVATVFNLPMPCTLAEHKTDTSTADSTCKISLTVNKQNNGKIFVTAENTSDKLYSDVNIYLALYDFSGSLTDVFLSSIDTLPAYKARNAAFKVSMYDIKEACDIKAFAWFDNATPCSAAACPKKSGIGDEQKNASIWMRSNYPVILSYGDEIRLTSPPLMIGELMVPVRALANALMCTVKYSAEIQEVTFEDNGSTLSVVLGSKKAVFNGDVFELSASPCMYDNTLYVPVIDIVEKFGYDAEFDYTTCEAFIYPGEINKLVEQANKRINIPRYIFEKDKSSALTKYDAAQLAVAFCETMLADKLEIPEGLTYPDTNDTNILKLGGIGLMLPEYDGNFKPYEKMTNSEFAVLILDALKYTEAFVPTPDEATVYFYDHSSIPSALRDSVYEMKAYGALDGVYKQLFYGKNPITVKQAIGVTENTFSLAYDTIFPDIEPGSIQKEIAVKLARLGIMSGREDGFFHPDERITRAELARLVTALLGVDNNILAAYNGTCTDVDETHWANRYIGYCVDNEIMELTNGCWEPERYASKSEALSAAVRALGCKNTSTPDELLDTADRLGLLEGLTDMDSSYEIKRIETAQLLYNAIKSLND